MSVVGCVVLFVVGLVWLLVIGLQNIMLVRGRSDVLLFVVGLFASLLWAWLVRRIVVGFDVCSVLSYSIGSAVGLIVSRRVFSRVEKSG